MVTPRAINHRDAGGDDEERPGIANPEDPVVIEEEQHANEQPPGSVAALAVLVDLAELAQTDHDRKDRPQAAQVKADPELPTQQGQSQHRNQ